MDNLDKVLVTLNERIAQLEDENRILRELLGAVYEPAKIIVETVSLEKD